MQHLNTKQCDCGTLITAHHKTGQLVPNHQKGFFGGNVKAFADGECPTCNKTYTLWLRQAKNTWEVVTLAPRGWEMEEEKQEKRKPGRPRADQ